MKILIIDGQGGRMGRTLVEQIKALVPEQPLMALGSNSIATAAMLKAGADMGATGENPVVFNSRDADLILGPIGIIVANALYGEITPAMARAVGESPAEKLLLPVKQCRSTVMGVQNLPMSEYVRQAAQLVAERVRQEAQS